MCDLNYIINLTAPDGEIIPVDWRNITDINEDGRNTIITLSSYDKGEYHIELEVREDEVKIQEMSGGLDLQFEIE